ncbi:MAG: nitroreductase family protein [Spirochaetota bacterium]
MSALIDIIRQRKSVRTYTDQPIAREHIAACVEAARLAPSAENVQPWRFIVLDDPGLKREFCTAVTGGIYRPSRFIARAAAVVVILARLDLLANVLGRSVQGTQFYLLDIGIAGEHLVLQAQELGIGTCWIGWFNARRAARFLQVPVRCRVVSLIAMGYPAEGATRNKPDLPLDEILFFNREAGRKL